MKIAVSSDGYPEKRNIMVDPENNYVNLKKKNIYLYINALRQKLLKKNKIFVFQPVPGLAANDADIIHLFNEVARTSNRWVSTFETEIPRVLPVAGVAKTDNPELHNLMQLAASKECVQLIAISEATSNIQLKLLEAFPALKNAIAAKLCVMHPPQPLLADKGREAPGDKVTFTFIGNEFYRKGGAEVVMAFSELANEGIINVDRIKVNIIGDLSRKHNIAHRQYQDGEGFHSQIEGLIKKWPFFQHSGSLPNSSVIALLKETDVGLLPTWQDTYGFSVLEMQACGCPVITTNVRALPEINPPASGWLIDYQLNDMYEFTVDSEPTKQRIRNTVVSQLKGYIADILHDPESISQRSAQAILRIRQQHDPQTFKKRLKEIYLS
ncbi:glycosyltransferase family 4 protein [Erwiniaceae bacterium L1_54_6]|nr:glycosyltransferase family 4 protein [Erwiniaceae bacterium L1_54_6]